MSKLFRKIKMEVLHRFYYTMSKLNKKREQYYKNLAKETLYELLNLE